MITGNLQLYFTTFNEFRRVRREHFEAIFVQALKLCREAGLVKLRNVAIDGPKARANASKHKAMSYKRMLRAEVSRLLAKAGATDASEDARYGEQGLGDELPEELRRLENGLMRIREIMAMLEAESRKTRGYAQF